MYLVVIANPKSGWSSAYHFTDYGSAVDFIQSALTSDDYKNLVTQITVVGEEMEDESEDWSGAVLHGIAYGRQ